MVDSGDTEQQEMDEESIDDDEAPAPWRPNMTVLDNPEAFGYKVFTRAHDEVRRDIPADTELSFDYGYGFKEWRQHPCRCGSAGCAGFIVNAGQRWLLRRALGAERAAR